MLFIILFLSVTQTLSKRLMKMTGDNNGTLGDVSPRNNSKEEQVKSPSQNLYTVPAGGATAPLVDTDGVPIGRAFSKYNFFTNPY